MSVAMRLLSVAVLLAWVFVAAKLVILLVRWDYNNVMAVNILYVIMWPLIGSFVGLNLLADRLER